MESNNHSQLTLFLTNTCNLNCVYCYEHRKNGQIMSFECATSWIEKCLNNDSNFVDIYLFGGEPLLQFPLIRKICEWTWARTWLAEYKFVVQTNGTLLDKPMKDWFSVHKEQIRMCLSIDGRKETHNRNRNNSFDKIDIPFFLNTWPDQPVKMTISKSNIGSLKDDVVWLQEQGFAIRGCNLAIGEGEYTQEFFDEFTEQLKQLADYYISHPDMVIAPLLNLPLCILSTEDRPQRISCNIGTGKLVVVNTDGSISPCSYFSDISFGKNNREKLRDVLSNIKVENNICYGKCPYFPICDMCYGENYSDTGDIYTPAEHKCKLMKIRIAASMYVQANRITLKQESNITYEDTLTIKTIQKYYQQIKNELL